MNIPIGSETFPHIATPDMPYVPDKTLARKIISLCSETPDPLFLYAVTIENHDPWKEKGTPLTSYLDHLKNSDAMIDDIMKALAIHDRSALFVFLEIIGPLFPHDRTQHPLFCNSILKRKRKHTRGHNKRDHTGSVTRTY